jgi:hypothetical protein
MIYLLQDVFERMPEAGDLERPRLVLFIDEAHLLFQDCPPALLQRIERTMRLIRSKSVGVFYITQSPADIPPNVVGQLGNRFNTPCAVPRRQTSAPLERRPIASRVTRTSMLPRRSAT